MVKPAVPGAHFPRQLRGEGGMDTALSCGCGLFVWTCLQSLLEHDLSLCLQVLRTGLPESVRGNAYGCAKGGRKRGRTEIHHSSAA